MQKGTIAYISKSLDGRITAWDQGAEDMFGYTAVEALTKPISIVIPFDFQDEEYELLDKLKAENYHEVCETVRRRKDGTFLMVKLSAVPIRDEGGKIIGATKKIEYMQDLPSADLPGHEAVTAG